MAVEFLSECLQFPLLRVATACKPVLDDLMGAPHLFRTTEENFATDCGSVSLQAYLTPTSKGPLFFICVPNSQATNNNRTITEGEAGTELWLRSYSIVWVPFSGSGPGATDVEDDPVRFGNPDA